MIHLHQDLEARAFTIYKWVILLVIGVGGNQEVTRIAGAGRDRYTRQQFRGKKRQQREW